MGKLNTFWAYLARHKYLITFVIGILITGVLDENSFRKYITQKLYINELNAEISDYQEQYDQDSTALRALLRDPNGAERIARERYLMKRPNEEIFIMRDKDMPEDE